MTRQRRRERKRARREARLVKGRRSPGWHRRREVAAEREADAMRVNDELLSARHRQSKRFDDAHRKRRRALADGVRIRRERWNPGTPNKRPPKGVSPGSGIGRPHR
jgi:hypothetical protein